MGNDGGVIAVKRKFMRHGNPKAHGEKADQEARRLERARTCAISSEPLREPVVACALGNLYNKQALLEQLLARTMPAKFRHITSLRDVVTCRFSSRPSGEGDADVHDSLASFTCPITMLPFNGKQPFVVLSSCGCVLSERAMKAVHTTECLVCNKPIEGGQVIALLPPEEQYEAAQKRLLEQKAEEKLARQEAKKNKKQHKTKRGTAAASEQHSGNGDVAVGEEETAPKTKNHHAKEHKKKGKRKAEHQSHAGEAGDGRVSKIARDANDVISQSKEKSKVFASLFSKDKSEKASANDLLMTIGGMRYTLS
ncbi:hypothetical protein BBJ28_00016722 [Nothophytophthora sp. Chile5]|nr:hypothetical protein BBJ28_00016722 [Nothophytophthora sp. Chile5]